MFIFQAQFAQVRAPGAITPLPTGMPGFHPGAPRLAPQQLYFGQGTPGLIPPQPAGYGFQQQLLPGIRPSVAPNFIMPYQLQRPGQPGQRFGARRGANAQQMQQQQVLISFFAWFLFYLISSFSLFSSRFILNSNKMLHLLSVYIYIYLYIPI